jgi:C4-dicarboxylate-specific signal transduction histidine kinase
LLEQLMQVARLSALEEMASGIAHELNQPIGAIATFAQAAQRMLNRPEPMVQPTGLGLASSRAISEAHEGSIGFENEAAGGHELLASPASGRPARGDLNDDCECDEGIHTQADGLHRR